MTELNKYITKKEIIIDDVYYQANYFEDENLTKVFTDWLNIYKTFNNKQINKYFCKILYCLLTNTVKIDNILYNIDIRKFIKIKVTYDYNSEDYLYDNDVILFHFKNDKDYDIYIDNIYFFTGNIDNIHKDFKILSKKHHKKRILTQVNNKLKKIQKLEDEVNTLMNKLI